MPDRVTFCPLITIVKEGQANYMSCQSTCVFYVEDECVFITTAKMLKEMAKSEAVDKSQRDES